MNETKNDYLTTTNYNTKQRTNKQLTSKDMKNIPEKQQEEKKIRPVLRYMQVGAVEDWPINRTDIVRATIYRLQSQMFGEWTTEKKGNILVVTRVA